jgi:excisionase family DNA binding protein
MIILNEKKYYTTREVANKFGFHVRTIQGWIRDGKLIPYKFGPKKFYFDESSIENCIKGK